jgi:hypothetical protein
MSDEYIFDNSSAGLNPMFEAHSRGAKILCPICRSELWVVVDAESAIKYSMPAGVYCPKSPKHVSRSFNISFSPKSKSGEQNIT